MSEDEELAWLHAFASSASAVLKALPVGGYTTDPELVEDLVSGVEGLFLRELPYYEGWPADSAIDGATVHLSIRREVDCLDIAGMVYIDFAGEVCPARVDLGPNGSGRLVVRGFLGSADGEVQRLTGGPLVLPGHSEDGRAVAELAHAHRQSPISWVTVFEGGLGPLPDDWPTAGANRP